jgi:hypothetical protein
MNDRLTALENLCNRTLEEIQYLKSFQRRQNPVEEPVKQIGKKKSVPER